jgi:CRP-like cAMP-binding protein
MYNNSIFSLLHARQADFLASHVTPSFFGAGAVLRGPQAHQSNVIFPETGLIAILAPLEDGRVIEVGLHGQFGASVPNDLIGVADTEDAEIAVTDVTAWSMKPTDVATLIEQDSEIRSAFLKNGHFLMRQSRQLAACKAWHPLNQRLPSWLLRASELSQANAFQITQEQISLFLGVSRTSLSVAASKLLAEGIIDYMRGRLQILDTAGLAARACECHQVLQDNRRRIFEPRAS